MSITVESQAKVYLEGTMVVFRNEENNLVRSESTGNIYYRSYKEGVIFYVKGESRYIMAVAAWNQVLNQAGTAYGATQAEVETALNAFLGFKKGGGGDAVLAYTQNTELQVASASVIRDSISQTFEQGMYIITANGDFEAAVNNLAFFSILVDAATEQKSNISLIAGESHAPVTIFAEVALDGEHTISSAFGSEIGQDVSTLLSSLEIKRSPNPSSVQTNPEI